MTSEGSGESTTRAEGDEPETRRERRTSGRVIAQSISIKGAERQCGGCAWNAVKLTVGELPRVLETGLRDPGGSLTARQPSAEGIVVPTDLGRRPERWAWRVGHRSHERNAAEHPESAGLSDSRAR